MLYYNHYARIENCELERAQRLLETIHQVGKDIKPKNFLHLALTRQAESRLDEATQIAEAVKYARNEQCNGDR